MSVHAWCRDHGRRFACLDEERGAAVFHVGGLSRTVRGRAPEENDLDEVERDLVARLAGYGVTWTDFDVPAVTWVF